MAWKHRAQTRRRPLTWARASDILLIAQILNSYLKGEHGETNSNFESRSKAVDDVSETRHNGPHEKRVPSLDELPLHLR